MRCLLAVHLVVAALQTCQRLSVVAVSPISIGLGFAEFGVTPRGQAACLHEADAVPQAEKIGPGE